MMLGRWWDSPLHYKVHYVLDSGMAVCGKSIGLSKGKRGDMVPRGIKCINCRRVLEASTKEKGNG